MTVSINPIKVEQTPGSDILSFEGNARVVHGDHIHMFLINAPFIVLTHVDLGQGQSYIHCSESNFSPMETFQDHERLACCAAAKGEVKKALAEYCALPNG
jgi:hypothetical protein